jgi:hypothetical protein
MKTILVRYKTASKERAEENAALIHAVFDQLRERGTAGVRYTTYRLADGVTFLHLATTENEKENPIPALPAFQAFQERIKERCVEPPVLTELLVVDAYDAITKGRAP